MKIHEKNDILVVMSKKEQKIRKMRNMFAFALLVEKRGKVQEDRRDRRSGEVVDPYEGWDDYDGQPGATGEEE